MANPTPAAWKTLTLPDLALRFDNGMLRAVVNLLSQKNRILEDIIFKASSETTQETFAIETKLPEGQYTAIGEGIQEERSDQDLVAENMGSLDSLNKIPWKLLRYSANPNALRTQEDMRFVKGMSHTLVGTLLYGNEAINRKAFTGLTPRYNSKAIDTVYSGGGTGNSLGSIWAVNWNLEDGAYCIYPQGRNDAGITMINMGRDTAIDFDNGGEYIVYRTFFNVEWGLVIKREDQIGRYGDLAFDLTGSNQPRLGPASGFTGVGNLFDYRMLIEMLDALWESEGVSLYANRKMRTQINLAAVDNHNVEYRTEEVYGKPTKVFQDAPIKLLEQLLMTESAMAA